jgi:trans-2,3-dihydro-3-hydroxyanthranilate isomerase
LAAAALSIEPAEILQEVHPPRVAGVGLPFLIVELQNPDVLARARCNVGSMLSLSKNGIAPDILLYVRVSGDIDIKARMFAPLDGVPEDPATGSANCALAAMLSHYDSAGSADYHWRIAQGVEMGRPSILDARTRKENGFVEATWIGGDCVLVCEGSIRVA